MSNKKKIILLTLPLAAIVALLILGCLNRIAIPNDQVGFRAGSIVWDGLERTHLIYIPSSYDRTKPTPLVIALHGGGGTGKDMVRLTVEGFNTLADREGFIVVYPDGIEKHWNDGRGGDETGYRAHVENIDDVGFISALIDHVVKELSIDRKRVYVTGMSNGAIMSHRLACELSDKITAIASVAGNIPERLYPKCAPTRPIPVMLINNLNDPLMPFEGGMIGTIRHPLGKVLSTSSTINFWIKHNQCSSTPTITCEPDRDSTDGTGVRKEAYENCKNGVEVILYVIEGGGHTWPGGYQYLPERFIGKTSRDIDANEVIWNFFKRHAIK